jgi:hypothetical protein
MGSSYGRAVARVPPGLGRRTPIDQDVNVSDYESLMRRLIREELREQLPVLLAEALAADRAAAAEQHPASGSVSAPAVATVGEVAALTRKHPDTVRLALADGALHGRRHRPRGKWIIERRCADAWIAVEPCVHSVNVTPIRFRRP